MALPWWCTRTHRTTLGRRPSPWRLGCLELEDRAVPATFTVTNTLDNGAGSLRQAIIDANNNPGPDLIRFNITGPSRTIFVFDELPAITDSVIIDGTTQPGFNRTTFAPVVQLRPFNQTGAFTPPLTGLRITGNQVVVRGLNIAEFGRGFGALSPGHQILIDGGSQNFIVGNYLGTNAAGNAGIPGGAAVTLRGGATNNQIGGSTLADRNLLSSSEFDTNVPFQTGTVGLFGGGTTGNRIQGNHIGTGADGVSQTGATNGVYISGASFNLVGGSSPGEGNIIRYTIEDGVGIVRPATGNSVIGNIITDIGAIPGGLNPEAIDHIVIAGGFNFIQNPQTGGLPNDRQNPPLISLAQKTVAGTFVQGTLISFPNTQFLIELYTNSAPLEELSTFLARFIITTNGSGLGSFSLFLPPVGEDARFLVGTATNLRTGSTSEVSPPPATPIEEPSGIINGSAFNDLNGNGVRDAGEPGLAGIQIGLDLNSDGGPDAITTTDADGNFEFVYVPNGTHLIGAASRDGFIFTTNSLQVRTVDNNTQTVGFGYFAPIAISGFKFHDLNNNGVFDPGEPGLADVLIQLLDGNGNLLQTTSTNSAGNFAFANLGPGTYQVREVTPAGYRQTTPNPAVITAQSGQNVTNLQFGNAFLTLTDTRTAVVIGTDVGAGTVAVYDAATGAVRFFLEPFGQFPGGVRVAQADVNGDGVADIIVGAGPGGGPLVRVYDGVTGAVISTFFAYDPSFTGGVYVAGGDLDGDGIAEVITGVGPGGGPHVRIFDGRTGQLRGEFMAYDPSFSGGIYVAAGDIFGIGRMFIITGVGYGGGPHVRVFDFVTGEVVASFMAYDPAYQGGVLVAAGDLDGDLFADIVTGAGPGGGANVRGFNGRTFQLITDFFAFDEDGLGQLGLATQDVLYNTGVRVAVVNGGPRGTTILAGSGQSKSAVARQFTPSAGLIASYTPFDPAYLGGIYVG